MLIMCGLHYWGHCNLVLFSHCLNNVSNNPRSKYKHEIARCNFWNSKYMIEIELGENGPGAFRPSPALVAPWTRAVSFSPRSISTKYSSAKPRSILLKNLSTMLKNLSAAPRGFEHCLEVFESIYFSYQKSHRAISYINHPLGKSRRIGVWPGT